MTYDGKFIYFIRVLRDDGPVKIGCSIYPMNRLVSLTTWCPYPLEIAATVPGDFEVERKVQNCFADLHTHREWFLPDPRLLAAIDRLKAGAALEDAIDLTDARGDVKAQHYRRRSEIIAAKRKQVAA